MRFPLQDAVMQNLEKSTWFEFMQCNSFHFTAHIIPILRARDYPPHSWSLPIFGKVFASFSKSAKKGGPGSVPAMADTEVGPPSKRRDAASPSQGRPPSQPPCASPEVLVRTKIFLDQHQNLFRPAPKLQRFRRSNYRQASPDSSTLTTDSRSGRETPKTTYRNAPQPLSKRVRRISTLKNG